MIFSPGHLANECRLVRMQQGLTQNDLAQRVGIKQNTVSRFETSPNSVKLETAFKIMQALGLGVQLQLNHGSSHLPPEW